LGGDVGNLQIKQKVELDITYHIDLNERRLCNSWFRNLT